MRLPDTNVLLHAVNHQAPQHAVARQWLEAAFAAPAGVGLAWAALLGFVHIATRAGIFARPLQPQQALQVLNHWLGQPGVQVLEPGPSHAALLGRLLLAAGTAGNLVGDAHLAALALEHGAELGTFDRDFTRFAGLRVQLLS